MKFKKSDISIPTRIIITGKSNTGKSVYTKNLLYNLADQIDKLYIFSPTYFDSPFRDIGGNRVIILEYDEDKLKDIIRKQKSKLDGETDLPHVVIVFDDCILDIKKNDKSFQSIFTRGRHYNLSPIVITQRLRLIPAVCRYNIDYLMCTKIFNSMEKEIVANEFNNIDKKEFYEMLNKATDGFGVLVINNSTSDAKDLFRYDRGRLKVPEFYI